MRHVVISRRKNLSQHRSFFVVVFHYLTRTLINLFPRGYLGYLSKFDMMNNKMIHGDDGEKKSRKDQHEFIGRASWGLLVGCLTFFNLFLLQTSSDIFFIHKLILPILVRILMLSVDYSSLYIANFTIFK